MAFAVRFSSLRAIMGHPFQLPFSSALKNSTDILELSLQVGWSWGFRKRSNMAGVGTVLVVYLKPKRVYDSQGGFKRSPVVDEVKFDVMVTGPLSGSLIGLGTGSRRHDYVFSVDVGNM
ncbi:uncharacterized protein FRV6_01227 [Fusarium oxysporum]|uniref:Uncharacterized protein n=1 Tax=Fusarium oxysporum TaxID=5507 RepID=A0A2H3SUG9_FUSOX|nr:uncharacterized protein FRV6_01227 [Fusarium oxysporum]